MSIPLAALEAIADASGTAPAIEALLPRAVRGRQLTTRTLLTGMLLALHDRRPAFLTEVHAALTALPEPDQIRLGVIAEWSTGPHQLTYRQVEHTCRLITRALAKNSPDGAPSPALQNFCGQLLEASIRPRTKTAAPRWPPTGPTSRPGPARPATAAPPAPTPRRTGGTAPATCPAPK